MLNGLKKKLGILPSEIKEEVSMEIETIVAAVADAGVIEANVELSALQASFAEQTSFLENVVAELTEVKAALAQFQEAAVMAEEKIKEMKLADRKAQISMNIGDSDKAEAFMAATGALGDAEFAAVMQAMSTTAKAEAESPLFKEAGLDAKVADVSKVTETAEMKALKAKYAAKSKQPK